MVGASPSGGWATIAETDGAALVLAAVVDLDADRTYSRSTLAEAAGVPHKTLFLADTLETLASAGLLERVDDRGADSEARYRLDDGSALYEAAVAVDEAVGARAPVAE